MLTELAKFLSTLSLRRATPLGKMITTAKTFLSTLSLRRATMHFLGNIRRLLISIHALLAESDRASQSYSLAMILFLSTLSLRRATNWPRVMVSPTLYFYPRSPCGERPRWVRSRRRQSADFYPRSPCGERPRYFSMPSWNTSDFYPRSPCGERHHESVRGKHCSSYFYPRSPCGERQFPAVSSPRRVVLFLSTLSLRRATYNSGWRECYRRISIHALLAESDILPLFWHLLL